ncbi:MAG: hypothetical protein GY801_06105 [bacterium]|nr:hypothetical protein [bacterium]
MRTRLVQEFSIFPFDASIVIAFDDDSFRRKRKLPSHYSSKGINLPKPYFLLDRIIYPTVPNV